MYEFNVLQKIAVWVLPVLFAITAHEVSHGWIAKRLGDPTAMMLGRLTLNPIKHVDPIGTVLVPLIMLLLPGGFVFGWAKPVPVTWENLKKPKRDMALVALAGPSANLLMAVGWALIARLGRTLILDFGAGPGAQFLVYVGVAGIFINVILMLLNLLPLPPLDGGRVLTGILPGPAAWQVSRIEPYGFIILVALLFTHVLDYILWPPILFTMSMLGHAAGMPLEVLFGVLSQLGA